MENEKKILDAVKRISHHANEEIFKLELQSDEYINTLISTGVNIIVSTFTTVKKAELSDNEEINNALDVVIKEIKRRILEQDN